MMTPGDLLVIDDDEVTPFMRPTPGFAEDAGELVRGDLLIYLDIWHNPRVTHPQPEDDPCDPAEHCHVMKVLTRLGVRWVNQDESVQRMDV